MARRTVLSLLTVAFTIAATACSGGGSDDDLPSDADTSTTTTSAPAATSTTAPSVPSLSFSDNAARAELGDGWLVESCEGDAPRLCVSRNGAHAGVVELNVFPVDSFTLPGFQDAVRAGDTLRALDILGNDFVSSFEKDRVEGCGEGFEVEPTVAELATVFGEDGWRFGYVLKRGRDIVERQVGHSLIDGNNLVLVQAPAFAPDGCVAPEREFEPGALAEFMPYLHALVATATR